MQKIRLRLKGQVVHHTVEEEAEIVEVTEAEIVEVTEADAAEAVIVVDMVEEIVAAQAVAVTRKAMADQATGQLIRAVEIEEAIQAVQQPVRIRTEAAAGPLVENPGIKNKQGNRGRRRRGSSGKLELKR